MTWPISKPGVCSSVGTAEQGPYLSQSSGVEAYRRGLRSSQKSMSDARLQPKGI